MTELERMRWSLNGLLKDAEYSRAAGKGVRADDLVIVLKGILRGAEYEAIMAEVKASHEALGAPVETVPLRKPWWKR
jgi:hypothetical protein